MQSDRNMMKTIEKRTRTRATTAQRLIMLRIRRRIKAAKKVNHQVRLCSTITRITISKDLQAALNKSITIKTAMSNPAMTTKAAKTKTLASQALTKESPRKLRKSQAKRKRPCLIETILRPAVRRRYVEERERSK